MVCRSGNTPNKDRMYVRLGARYKEYILPRVVTVLLTLSLCYRQCRTAIIPADRTRCMPEP
jgi:hypothetical protein